MTLKQRAWNAARAALVLVALVGLYAGAAGLTVEVWITTWFAIAAVNQGTAFVAATMTALAAGAALDAGIRAQLRVLVRSLYAEEP